MSAYRRVGVSCACRRVSGWIMSRSASQGSTEHTFELRAFAVRFTFARSIDVQRRSRVAISRLALRRHAERNATASHAPIRRYADTTPLNCLSEHGTFACFEAAQKYLVRLHRERLPKSDGRGVIPPDGCESP